MRSSAGIPTWLYVFAALGLLGLAAIAPNAWRYWRPGTAPNDVLPVYLEQRDDMVRWRRPAATTSVAAGADTALSPARLELKRLTPGPQMAALAPRLGQQYEPDFGAHVNDFLDLHVDVPQERMIPPRHCEESAAEPHTPPAPDARSGGDVEKDSAGGVPARSHDPASTDWSIEGDPGSQPSAPYFSVPLVESSAAAEELSESSVWPRPTALLMQLDAIAFPGQVAAWISAVRLELARLTSAPTLGGPDADRALTQLELLALDGKQVVQALPINRERAELQRAVLALARRLVIWRQVQRSVGDGDTLVPASYFVAPQKMREILDAVERQMVRWDRNSQWREYLRLTGLREATLLEAVDADALRRRAARQTLIRLESSQLTVDQRRLLEAPEFGVLAEALRQWSAEPVDCRGLLQRLEDYELRREYADARALADQWRALNYCSDPRSVEIARRLDTHYRNANVRIAIGEALINRLLPGTHHHEEDVYDHILGARVFGRSRTSTRIAVRLMPDRMRLRMGLEATGVVDSDTHARQGPVTLYNQGQSNYIARKLLLVDADGVRIGQTEADALSETRLIDLATDFDGFPILGAIVRNAARAEHDSQYWAAQREVESRVAWRVQRRMDEEIHSRVEMAEDKFRTQVIQPLQRMNLEPSAVSLQTTPQRLIVRCRLAGQHQLAAHTPRPRAPGDSHLSVQIHQSAVNNVIEQLRLAGWRGDLRQLFAELIVKSGRTDLDVPEDLPDGVTVEFAAAEPVRVDFEDGRVVVTLRIAELAAERDRWRNLVVRTTYRGDPTQLTCELSRDGIIELVGERLSFRDQIALRGVFSKVFSKSRSVNVIGEQIAHDPRLRYLQVSQLLIEDGWLGVALSPNRDPQLADGGGDRR